MFTREEPVLVAVSGGKDSLALWDVLHHLGYRTTGLHLDLGIGGYSQVSRAKTEAFARERGLPLLVVDFTSEGHAIPEVVGLTRRPACSACGTAKRHHFDRVALEHGFPVVATGHNLDDEAARLLGNVLRWDLHYLARQSPVLAPSHEKFARKVKPLFRLSEYETAAYAFLRKIDYVLDECPNAVGASQLLYKEVLQRLEADMPGTKQSFVVEFYRRARPALLREELDAPTTCTRCGLPSHRPVCRFCSLLAEVEAKRHSASQRPASPAPAE
ncbi:MAG: adenine nucleotide alpha hydrolase family protein [Candidatus Binatia bacterium]|nr:adenine nucleotide alpha hydrolase family protein [Candidatus Binatia bacterium]